MLDHAQLRRAFRSRLLASSPVIVEDKNYAWENVPFNQPNDVWIKENLLPGTEQLSSNTLFEASGMYQLSVVFPVGSSVEKPEAIAKRLVELFKAASHFSEGGLDVAIDRSWRSPSMKYDASTNHIPVKVLWRAYSPR